MISEPDWDWYGCTLPGGPDEVLGMLSPHGEPQPCRGLYSYEHGMAFLRSDGEAACRAFWGGVNGERSVHVQCSGAGTRQVVADIRASFPEHRVARADVCADWCDATAWRQLSKAALAVRKQFALASRLNGDWVSREDGRTIYLGGRSSYVQARLYEKGKQLGTLPDWVRLEIQVRPAGEGKSNLARAEPGQLFSVCPWTRELSARVGVPELEAVRIRDPWQPGDDERALEYMLLQYGGLLRREKDRRGSWDAVWELLRARLAPTPPAPEGPGVVASRGGVG